MSKKFTKHLIAASLSCAFLNTAAFAEDDNTAHESMETIVIMGEKADRTLKDTASSVSVINEELLKTLTHLSVTSAVSEIANVVVKPGALPDIRGVSGNGAAAGFNGVTGGAKGRVSILVDGIYQPYMADLTGDSGIWDVEQIEVFRGPQSTTNGRNSIGGMIFIKTKDPSFDWEAAGRLGYRNQSDYIDTSVMASGPIIADELAFRFTAQGLQGNDYDNSIIHPTHDPEFDLDKLKTTRYGTKLLWKPKALEGFSTMLSFDSNSEEGNSGRRYFRNDDPWAFVPNFERNMDTDTRTTKLNVDYTIDKDSSVDVLWAYMDHRWGFNSYELVEARNQLLIMNEKNVTFDGKYNFGLDDAALKGFIGLAYFEREQDYQSHTGFLYQGNDSSDSRAIYGEVSYNINEQFSVISGLRVEQESQFRDYIENAMEGEQLVHRSRSILDQENTIRLPKVVLQYKINDQHTANISARRGYNSAGGAFNWMTQQYYYYDAEYVNTYEAGLRSSLNDGNVNFSANVFFNAYQGYQAVGPNRNIDNLARVDTYGLELEVSAMLSDNLQVTGGLGLLETEMKDGTETFKDLDGKELNSAPKITANAGIKYWINDAFNVGFSGNYVDEFFGTFTNEPEKKAGNYSLVRVHANYELENWLFNVFVSNALDRQAITHRSPANARDPYGNAGIIDPRTFGISATYAF